MVIYTKLKQFISENKRRFGFLAACVVIFGVGYGTGKSAIAPLYENVPKSNISTFNYNTSGGKPTNPSPTKNKPAGDPNCPIKGNITTKKEQKYYKPEDRGYAQVKPEQCFATEEEAQTSGFVGVGSGK